MTFRKIWRSIASPRIQRCALALNVLSASLLFCSFQAGSSEFSMIKSSDPHNADDYWYTICVEDKYALVNYDVSRGNTMIASRIPGGCPAGHRVAIVKTDYPVLIDFSFIALTIGFLLQCFGIPESSTTEDIRKIKSCVREAAQLVRKAKELQSAEKTSELSRAE